MSEQNISKLSLATVAGIRTLPQRLHLIQGLINLIFYLKNEELEANFSEFNKCKEKVNDELKKKQINKFEFTIYGSFLFIY